MANEVERLSNSNTENCPLDLARYKLLVVLTKLF